MTYSQDRNVPIVRESFTDTLFSSGAEFGLVSSVDIPPSLVDGSSSRGAMEQWFIV